MTGSSRNISHKLPPESVEVLCDVALLAIHLDVPFFVVGATARDMIFGALYDIPPSRTTFDIDLALRVADWKQYASLRTALLHTQRYTEDRHHQQRLHHDNGAALDLVPFGPLEAPTGVIAWPPGNDVVMSTSGFEEALASSIEVIVAEDPERTVRVCTPAALAAMKLIAWHDNYPARTKDAQDLLFLMKEYIHAGNQERLYDTAPDILAAAAFSLDVAGPRLLGRDIRRMVHAETREKLLAILTSETADDSQFRLLSDMTRTTLRDDARLEEVLLLLRQLTMGLALP